MGYQRGSQNKWSIHAKVNACPSPRLIWPGVRWRSSAVLFGCRRRSQNSENRCAQLLAGLLYLRPGSGWRSFTSDRPLSYSRQAPLRLDLPWPPAVVLAVMGRFFSCSASIRHRHHQAHCCSISRSCHGYRGWCSTKCRRAAAAWCAASWPARWRCPGTGTPIRFDAGAALIAAACVTWVSTTTSPASAVVERTLCCATADQGLVAGGSM